jgi:predicted ATP-binding protein involved in virulence
VLVLIQRLVLEGVGPFKKLDMSFPEGKDPDKADIHLLVGVNGTGKTTVLQAIAQCFSRGKDIGLKGRFRSKTSAAGIEANVGMAGIQPVYTRSSGIFSFLSTPVAFFNEDSIYNYFGSGIVPHYNGIIWANLDTLRQTPISCAIFAYSGLRSAQSAQVTTIAEQPDNPLRDACLFTRPEGITPLIQWIANTSAREALYARQGNTVEAADRARSIQRLSDALSQITGVSVQFILEIDPFAVKVRLDQQPPITVDLLPDGLQSLLSWIGDLLMRLDRIPWEKPGPITDQPFVLLLDEVEVHLHPAWQRKVLPVLERLFPNAQVIASTHSPFVIGSASDAWTHLFHIQDGEVIVDPPHSSVLGQSYPAIVSELMGIEEQFDVDSEEKLSEFKKLCEAAIKQDDSGKSRMEALAKELGERSIELRDIVSYELRRLKRLRGVTG